MKYRNMIWKHFESMELIDSVTGQILNTEHSQNERLILHCKMFNDNFPDER